MPTARPAKLHTVMEDLVRRLRKSFTASHLSELTQQVLELYRRRDLPSLQDSYRKLRRHLYTLPDLKDPARIFTTLIKLLHPDRLNHYLGEIENAVREKNRRRLDDFDALIHFVIVKPAERPIFENGSPWQEPRPYGNEEEPAPVQEDWAYGEEDFDEVRDSDVLHDADDEESEGELESDEHRTFAEALLLEEHGLSPGELTRDLLSAIEGELDLSDYAINDLAGLGACVNLVSLNLSANEIEDIEEIAPLVRLKELNLAGNRIADVSPIAGLVELRELDLSFNHLDDVSPLFSLPALEFVNLVGNPVSKEDLQRLMENGVIAVCCLLIAHAYQLARQRFPPRQTKLPTFSSCRAVRSGNG